MFYDDLLRWINYSFLTLLQRALLRKHIFTSKELATLALLNSDSEEESGDENLISNPLKLASTSKYQYPRALSPAVSVVSTDDSSSEISVTRLSPTPIEKQSMPMTEVCLSVSLSLSLSLSHSQLFTPRNILSFTNLLSVFSGHIGQT